MLQIDILYFVDRMLVETCPSRVISISSLSCCVAGFMADCSCDRRRAPVKDD